MVTEMTEQLNSEVLVVPLAIKVLLFLEIHLLLKSMK